MTEIRICWNKEVSLTKISRSEGGLWIPETPQNLEDFGVIVEAGNQSFGPGSHWIDRREA
jgi:hypothetical protein